MTSENPVDVSSYDGAVPTTYDDLLPGDHVLLGSWTLYVESGTRYAVPDSTPAAGPLVVLEIDVETDEPTPALVHRIVPVGPGVLAGGAIPVLYAWPVSWPVVRLLRGTRPGLPFVAGCETLRP